jgi:oxygen-independent coproporphyrinogen-3 oxidase
VEALLREIEIWSEMMPIVWPDTVPIDTVYLGGGTPSSLAPKALDEILAALCRDLPIGPDAEITLEANPEDVTEESLGAWRALGVTNLSLGLQSFDERALRFLGRSHDPAHASAALEAALDAPFKTVSLDLIFALPGQSPERWRADLETAILRRPDHVSCYELTIHEGTRFSRLKERGILREPGEDERSSLFFLTHEVLADHGYAAYEVSNFARAPEHRSAHNRKYWDHTAYLGLGPSAHSFDGVATRWWNERRLRAWEAGVQARRGAQQSGVQMGAEGGIESLLLADQSPVAGCESLDPTALALESLALGLRTTAGADLERIRHRYDIDVAGCNEELIGRLRHDGFLVDTGTITALSPTVRGLAVADALARSFEIPPQATESSPSSSR